MSNERDPRLQALFAEADEALDDSEFTRHIMDKMRRRKMQRRLSAVLAVLALLVVASQFLQSLQPVAVVVTQVLTIELIDLGNSPAGWILAPINNLATVLIILGKGLEVSWGRVRQSTYTN